VEEYQKRTNMITQLSFLCCFRFTMQKSIRILYTFGNLQETSAKDHPNHWSILFGSTPTSDPTLTKQLCYENWTRNIRTSGLSRKVSANFGIVTNCQNFRARMNSGNVHQRHLVTVQKPTMSHNGKD
jgi:hypothetical protein